MTVYAHAEHWFASVLYAAPLIVLLGWMGLTRLRERRRGPDA